MLNTNYKSTFRPCVCKTHDLAPSHNLFPATWKETSRLPSVCLAKKNSQFLPDCDPSNQQNKLQRPHGRMALARNWRPCIHSSAPNLATYLWSSAVAKGRLLSLGNTQAGLSYKVLSRKATKVCLASVSHQISTLPKVQVS